MNIDYLIAEKWSGQNRTCRTGSAAPEVPGMTWDCLRPVCPPSTWDGLGLSLLVPVYPCTQVPDLYALQVPGMTWDCPYTGPSVPMHPSPRSVCPPSTWDDLRLSYWSHCTHAPPSPRSVCPSCTWDDLGLSILVPVYPCTQVPGLYDLQVPGMAWDCSYWLHYTYVHGSGTAPTVGKCMPNMCVSSKYSI